MFCPKCGAKTADTARFCPKCGQALKAPVPNSVSSPQPAPVSPPPAPAEGSSGASMAAREVSRKGAGAGKTGSRAMTLLPLLALLLALGVGILVCGSAASRTAPDEGILDREEASPAELMAEGNAAYSREDYELALEFYLLAAERSPQDGDPRSRAGDACFRLHREEEALGHYQAALMLYGDGTLPLQSAQNFYHLTEE